MAESRIALASHRAEQWRNLLESQPALPVPVFYSDQPGFAEEAAHCDILLGDTPEGAEWLPRLPNIAWYHTTYSGIDALLAVRHSIHQDVLISNSRDIAGPHIAEYVIGHLLNRTRLIGRFAQHQALREWRWQDYETLLDQSGLVLGTGAIGSTVAQRLLPWVQAIDGISRSGDSVEGFRRVNRWPAAEMDLSQYRFVVNTLPYTPDTHDLLDARFFRRLGPSAVFINTGRGHTVVERDLLAALDEAPGRHAVLDVFREEPLPDNHPFWAHPQVTVTPHVAALSRPEWVLPIFLDNLQRYLSGDTLRNRMDLDRGY